MKMRWFLHVLVLVTACGYLQACSDTKILTTNDIDPDGHLSRRDYLGLRERQDEYSQPQKSSPPPIPEMPNAFAAPAVSVAGSNKLVSISVTDSVPLRDVLIELAREAKVNLELDSHIQGGVIFSAHNQPFDEVLKRICALAGLRTVTEGKFIRIELDEPFQQTYQLDYLSLSRKSTSETSIATNVFDVNVANGSGTNGGSGGSNSNGANISENNSTSKVSGNSDADFWSEVDKSLTQILSSTGARDGRTKDKPVPNFSMDKQEGMVTVYADSIQQAAVDAYFTKLKRKAYSQVLIDARIIEVELNDSFKSGINWSTLFNRGLNIGANFVPTGGVSPTSVFTASANVTDFSAIVNLVRDFGTTRVLSSPRLTVLNNQTAVLKVATNQVYFVTQAQFTTVTNANGSAVTTTPVYTSTPHTVPVGLVMTVQPSIDAEHNSVTMTLRPTISRVVSEVNDPSIGLNAAQAGVANAVQSQIPVLAVREMDSVIQLHSGEVAVMGGLMQDSSTNNDQGIPGLDTLPVAGNLFKSRDNEGATTELVILLRATIADPPEPDTADRLLYKRFNNDPRPMPLPTHVSTAPAALAPDLPPLPSLPEFHDPS